MSSLLVVAPAPSSRMSLTSSFGDESGNGSNSTDRPEFAQPNNALDNDSLHTTLLVDRRRTSLPSSSDAVADRGGEEDDEETNLNALAAAHPGSHSSLLTATMTMAISAAGAGMLSFPYATRMQGMAATVVCTILFAVLNGYTLSILARFLALHGSKMAGRSYEELMLVALGPRAYVVSLVTILIGGVGAMTGFLLILLSLGHQVMWQLCTETDPVTDVLLHNHCGFWSSRTAIALVLCTCVIFPLSFMQHLHKLRLATWLSFLSVASVMLVVVYRAGQALLGRDSDGNHISPYPLNPDQAHVRSFAGAVINIEPKFFLGWPILIFSLGCSLQLPLVYLELTPAARARGAMDRRVIPAMEVLVVLLYLLTGLAGFVCFGAGVDGDILLNYSAKDPMANVAKALMAVHVALAFPIAQFPARAAMDFFFLRYFSVQPSMRKSVAQSVGLIVLAATFAVLVPQVQSVFGLLGSTISVTQTYALPALLLLSLPNKHPQAISKGKWDWDRRVGWALLVWSAFVCVLGTTATISDML
jgi:sodium-coupled neutral amino acid transporter 7/8